MVQRAGPAALAAAKSGLQVLVLMLFLQWCRWKRRRAAQPSIRPRAATLATSTTTTTLTMGPRIALDGRQKGDGWESERDLPVSLMDDSGGAVERRGRLVSALV